MGFVLSHFQVLVPATVPKSRLPNLSGLVNVLKVNFDRLFIRWNVLSVLSLPYLFIVYLSLFLFRFRLKPTRYG